jgi:hypothetical protein
MYAINSVTSGITWATFLNLVVDVEAERLGSKMTFFRETLNDRKT